MREAAKGEDTAAIKSAVDQLEQASHAFSKAIYEKSNPQKQAEDSPQPSWRDDHDSADDAIDAEFEVKT